MEQVTTTADEADYVIVGGGAAGCVLAARLGERTRDRIVMLEAGPRDRSPLIRIPAGVIKLLFDKRYAWQFRTEPSEGTAMRRVFAPQGRTLGGSSSINGMIYNRGQAQDYDGWEEGGAEGWSYRDVLTYFRRSERRIGGEPNQYHGATGPLPVSDADWTNPAIDAFIDGVSALGLPRNPDYNGASQEGVGTLQRVIEDGRRVSAARAFLHPAGRRIDVRTRAHATEIVFEGRRAVGVRYTDPDGRTLRLVRARKEVLVCTGALNTPKLLQLSGIGAGPAISALGLPVVADLPGVGQNLQDHFGTRSVVRIRNAPTANELSRWPYLGVEIGKWLMKKPSILGLSSSLAYVFARTDPSLDRPDLQFVLTPMSFKAGQFGVVDRDPGFSLASWQHRPESRGTVAAGSPSWRDDPVIQPNYLASEVDQRVTVAGIRLARTFLQTPQMARFVAGEVTPGADIRDDAELLHYARQFGSTIYHFCGTCRMGDPDRADTVVGPDLRLKGVDGLRVVDASVMPTVPSGNTYAPTLMIAERAADLIISGGSAG
ncbi:GMC family oxidoreductase [Pseudoroseicyclus sp. CXY001]|uniref:GMC family oxidoreductase n=1 Tax=Pseudoroseicyclus sp. CXY001 TaxID=3242492 RepID=UPI00358DC918